MTELGKLALKGLVGALAGIASGVRSAVVTGFRRLGDLGSFLLEQGKALGRKIIDGVVNGIKAAPGRIRDAIGGMIPDSIGGIPVPGFLGGASGGFIPGMYRGRDDRLMRSRAGKRS